MTLRVSSETIKKLPKEHQKMLLERGRNLITDQEFNSILDEVSGVVEDMMQSMKWKEFHPILLVAERNDIDSPNYIKSENGKHKPFIVNMVPLPLDAWAKDRHATMETVGRIFRKENKKPCCVFLASEVWMTSVDTNNKEAKEFLDKYKKGEVKITDSPLKEEHIIVSGATMDLMRQNMCVFKMSRTNEKNIFLGPKTMQYSKEPFELSAFIIENFFQGYLDEVGNEIVNEILSKKAAPIEKKEPVIN